MDLRDKVFQGGEMEGRCAKWLKTDRDSMIARGMGEEESFGEAGGGGGGGGKEGGGYVCREEGVVGDFGR